MSRISTIEQGDAKGRAKALLEGVAQQLGTVPNMYKALAHAPAALDGYLQFSGALSRGTLSPALREQIALTVAGLNSCDYCASAHTYLGRAVGLDAAALESSLSAVSDDRRTQAALDFAKAVVEARGRLRDAQLDALRAAGFSDGELVEIVGHVALNIFTNYFNQVAQTEVDFPLVETAIAA